MASQVPFVSCSPPLLCFSSVLFSCGPCSSHLSLKCCLQHPPAPSSALFSQVKSFPCQVLHLLSECIPFRLCCQPTLLFECHTPVSTYLSGIFRMPDFPIKLILSKAQLTSCPKPMASLAFAYIYATDIHLFASSLQHLALLDQLCPVELRVLIDEVSNRTVQYGSHQPCVATEHSKCA